MRRELRPLLWMLGGFAAFYFLPVGRARFDGAVMASLELAHEYAREHVLLCLVPAFLIAGAVSVFVRQGAVMQLLGADARKSVAYAAASVSGSVLAVCSCTVLPLFAGIYRMGAGLGPATAFLYSGPAINVLAVILTARILGPGLGLARALGAVVFSIVIGLLMHLIFRGEEEKRAATAQMPAEAEARTFVLTILQFVGLIGFLVFANWSTAPDTTSWWRAVAGVKWYVSGGFGLLALWVALRTSRDVNGEWLKASWDFAKQILPLLVAGVLVAGLLLGHAGREGLVPASWIGEVVGGNSAWANLIAAASGALMYFATLTEVPILQGLMGAGMGAGPALALMLSGPAISLPSLLVLRSILGVKKTLVFALLVIVMSSLTGWIYGLLVRSIAT